MNRFILWLVRFVEFRHIEKIVQKTWVGRMNGNHEYRWFPGMEDPGIEGRKPFKIRRLTRRRRQTDEV